MSILQRVSQTQVIYSNDTWDISDSNIQRDMTVAAQSTCKCALTISPGECFSLCTKRRIRRHLLEMIASETTVGKVQTHLCRHPCSPATVRHSRHFGRRAAFFRKRGSVLRFWRGEKETAKINFITSIVTLRGVLSPVLHWRILLYRPFLLAKAGSRDWSRAAPSPIAHGKAVRF